MVECSAERFREIIRQALLVVPLPVLGEYLGFTGYAVRKWLHPGPTPHPIIRANLARRVMHDVLPLDFA